MWQAMRLPYNSCDLFGETRVRCESDLGALLPFFHWTFDVGRSGVRRLLL